MWGHRPFILGLHHSLTRAATLPISLLGQAFGGAISTDRYAACNTFNVRRQICEAHRKRDLQSEIDAGGDGAKIGERSRASLREMFCRWHYNRDGTIQRQTITAQHPLRLPVDSVEHA